MAGGTIFKSDITAHDSFFPNKFFPTKFFSARYFP